MSYRENAGARLKADIRSYEDGERFLGKATSKPLGHNTTIARTPNWEEPSGRRLPDIITVVLHSTAIVRYYAEGVIKLDSGGWQTATTKARINKLLPPGISIYSKRRQWVVSYKYGPGFAPGKEEPFFDGMFISTSVGPIRQVKPEHLRSSNPRLTADDVSVTKKSHSGALEIAAIIDGRRVSKVYYGYSQQTAIRLFVNEFGGKADRSNNPRGREWWDGEGEYPVDPHTAIRGPGKFEGNVALAKAMYDASMESGEDESLGDSESFGWYALFTDFEYPGNGKTYHAIIQEGSTGFVHCNEFDSAADAKKAWAEIEAEWEESQEGDDDA